jgi:DNA polymerase elongation subunit (family B)
MIVETKNASLSTLAVTIQALHVSGKQMTLAVFRQLPDKKETKACELWGVVRYFIKDEGYLWLVYSENGILYRRDIRPHEPQRYDSRLVELKNELQRAIDNVKRYEDIKWEKYLAEAQQSVAKLEKQVAEEHENVENYYARDVAVYERESYLANLTQLFIAV